MERLPQTPRHVAVATALQLYANVDPDSALDVAERVLFAADRAAWRGHSDNGPTHAEINRAVSSFERQGIAVTNDQMYGALLCALCPGLIAGSVHA